MENLINSLENLNELSGTDLLNINGGNETVSFTDSKGYTWDYTYNDSGGLVGIYVHRNQCIL